MTIWTIPDELRPEVIAASTQAGVSVDAWLTSAVLASLPKPDSGLEVRLLAGAYGPDSAELIEFRMRNG